MAVCKECGALNPDSNKFCSECGQPIVKLDSKAIRDAMSQLEAEFEQDALVSLDRSRLTYICDVCGKVNPIDAKQCQRCGKKRPRSDYINALTKIKNSKTLKNAVVTMAKSDEKTEPEAVLPKVVKEEKTIPPAPILPKEEAEEKCEERRPMQLYRLDTSPEQPQQTRQIVQPFVIVPYVSQNQPLLQYDPNQIYRYNAYSDAEKKEQAERLARAAEEEFAKKERANQLMRENDKQNTEKMLSQKLKEKKAVKKAKKPSSTQISVVSFFAVVVGVLGLLAAFIDLIAKDFTMLQYIKGSSTIQLITSVFDSPSFTGSESILFFLYGLLVLLFLVTLVVAVLQNVVRVFTGRIRKKGFLNLFVPLLALIFAIGIVVVNIVNNSAALEVLLKDAYGFIVAIAVAVILLILYIVAGCKPKKQKTRRG